MKLTESQLRELVNEEIAAMIDEGEIDEGLFSGLGKLARKAGEGIKTAGKAIAKTYKTGSLTGDLNLGIKYLTQVIAKAERNRTIDSDVVTYRAAVITKCDEIETAIKACSDLDAFKKLFDSPVDSDGKPTGNPPIFDWPEK